MYKLVAGSDIILRINDGAWIPPDPANSDYRAYLYWIDEGNVPLPPDPVEPPLPPEPIPVPVPPSVPMWTVRTVLQNDNLFDQAQAIITASTDNALKNVWEYGNFAERNSPAIISLGTQLGLTSEQIDQMFRDANNLTV